MGTRARACVDYRNHKYKRGVCPCVSCVSRLPPVSPVQRHRGEPDTLTLQVQDRSAPGLRLLSRPRIRFSVVAKSRAGVLLLVGLDGREASV